MPSFESGISYPAKNVNGSDGPPKELVMNLFCER